MREKWLWITGITLSLLTINPSGFSAENLTLQELIDQTPSQGTLLLENKTYNGNVVITKPITIIGYG